MKLLGALLIVTSAWASLARAEIQGVNCDEPGSRTETAMCLIPEVNDAEEVMSRLYFNLQDELEKKCKGDVCPKLKEKLRTAQLKWIAYRDNFCELETIHLTDKDESDFQFAACLISETKRKSEELRVQQLNFRLMIYQREHQPQ